MVCSVDIALASSAAPTFFPVVPLTNPESQVVERFCDGGVAANHPALLGYAEAVSELKEPPERVQLLSISTPRSDLAEPAAGDIDRGILAWRHSLPSVLIESPSQISHELMKRIVLRTEGAVAPLYQRIELSNPDRLDFDRADEQATQQLILIGSTEAALHDTRNRVGRFFATRGTPSARS